MTEGHNRRIEEGTINFNEIIFKMIVRSTSKGNYRLIPKGKDKECQGKYCVAYSFVNAT